MGASAVSGLDRVMREIWEPLRTQSATPTVFERTQPPVTPEERAAQAAQELVDAALVEGFMEHFWALADGYQVTLCGDDDGSVYVVRGAHLALLRRSEPAD